MEGRIGFACTNVFHYVHFKRIAELFGDRACFIIATPKYTNHRYEILVDFFENNRVAYADEDAVISGKVKLDAIVAPYFLPFFNFSDPRIKRVRVLYGYAKDAWNYADWNTGFDLILAYGPYSFERLSPMAPTVSIGHPRFMGKGTASYSEVTGIDGRKLSEWLAQSTRNTVLYCPTWGGLSSIEWFRKALDGLLSKYRVIIKLHHGISLSNDYSYKDLSGEHTFLCNETVDLFDLFPVSDIVVSDYSGAIFDAVLAEKRLLLVNSIPADVKDTGIYNIKRMSSIGRLGSQGTGGNESLDIQIRKLVSTVDEPKDIVAAVERLLNEPVADYSKLNEQLYAYQDGLASERAYKAISEVVDKDGQRRKNDYPGRFRTEEFQAFINKHNQKSFVVWGAGSYGQLLVSWLMKSGYHVKAILDSQKEKQGNTLYGIPIQAPKTMKWDANDRLIISFIPGKGEDLAALVKMTGVANDSWILPF